MPVITNLNELLKQFVDERVAIHHLSATNTSDPEGDFATAGETDTYTFWADAAETINLGYFSVTNGYDSEGTMGKAIYDTNNNGIVDNSEALGGKSLSIVESERDIAITQAINDLIGGAPEALDTLNELAASLADDAAFSTTVVNALSLKLDSSVYTATDVKSKYESNINTNVFTDAEKTKLNNLTSNIVVEW